MPDAIEEQLRASEQQLEAAIRYAGLTFFLMDRELRYTWIRNPRLRSAAEVIGHTDEEIIGARDAAFLRELKERVLATGIGSRNEVRVDDPDGLTRWYDVMIEPQFDASGSVTGLIGATADITQHVAERNQLRMAAAEQRVVADIGREALVCKTLRDLFALAAARVRGVLTADRVAVFEGVDDRTIELAAGDPDWPHEEIRMRPALLAYLTHETIVVDDILIDPRFDAEIFAGAGLRSVVAVVVDGGANASGVLAAYCRDPYGFHAADVEFLRSVGNVLASAVSRTRTEAELRNAERLASLGHLAASMAHEFNNVLMAISPFAELVRKMSRENVQVVDAADHVARAITRGKRITGEVLRFVNPSEPALSTVDVTALLEQLAETLRSALPPSIALAVEVEDRPLLVKADAAQLEQVLTNLVVNARDAINDRGGVISILAKPASGGFVDVAVRDNGPGIPPQILPRIFEPFFTTKRSGTGLGLAIARQIVLNHGGEMTAENDGGALFRISLRRADEGAEVARQRETKEPLPFRRAVVIEDDVSVAYGLRVLLELLNIDVATAMTAAAGIDLVGDLHPDLVVLDVSLPDRDGRAVYEELVARWPDLRILFSTGHADETLLENVLKNPNVRWLMKPYSIEALESALAELARSISSSARRLAP